LEAQTALEQATMSNHVTIRIVQVCVNLD